MTIDMHSHWSPPELADAFRARPVPPHIVTGDDGTEMLVTARGRQPVDGMFDDLDTRLAEMDRQGISTAVLSLFGPHQWIERLPVEESVPLVRLFNDGVSAICAQHEGRFAAYASLPQAEMDAAVAEFERAIKLPGIVGAIVPGNAFRTYDEAQAYRPLLEAADRHRAVLFVHWGPRAGDEWPRVKPGTDNFLLRLGTLDMQANLSSCTITLTMTDILDDYPNARVHIHNFGGNIPFELERMDHRNYIDSKDQPLPSSRVRRPNLWFDCNSFGPKVIEMGVATYGADRIVFATDGTEFGCEWTNKALAETKLSAAEQRMIRHDNAAAMLSHLVPLAHFNEAAE
ncbi:MAG: amidohydrolase family protein [Rhodospirillaceae bacterium]